MLEIYNNLVVILKLNIMELNRRNFMKKAALAGLGTAAISAGAMAASTAGEKQQKKPITSANDKIRMGFIGVGARGRNHLSNTFNIGKMERMQDLRLNGGDYIP